MKGDTRINDCPDQYDLTVKTGMGAGVFVLCLTASVLAGYMIPDIVRWPFWLYGLGVGAIIALKTNTKYFTAPVVIGSILCLLVTGVVFSNRYIPWFFSMVAMTGSIIAVLSMRSFIQGFRKSFLANRMPK